MHKKLLFSDDTKRHIPVGAMKNIPIDVIQKLTSEAMSVHIDMMYLPDRAPGARKREYVSMRQISMALSKEYTKMSLSAIGSVHGGRDHATTLHAVKTVHNLIDAKDHDMMKSYKDALELIKEWNDRRTGELLKRTLRQLRRYRKDLENRLEDTIRQIDIMLRQSTYVDAQRNELIKFFIRNHMSLEYRQKKLKEYAIAHQM